MIVPERFPLVLQVAFRSSFIEEFHLNIDSGTIQTYEMAVEDHITVSFEDSLVLTDGRSSDDIEQLSESQTLLRQNEGTVWKPPKGFVWIQVGALAYLAQEPTSVANTLFLKQSLPMCSCQASMGLLQCRHTHLSAPNSTQPTLHLG